MQKIDKKELINKIGFIVVLATIVLLNTFIGSNIKQPIWIVQSIVSVFALIYLIIAKINKTKNIIIKSKIDIVVLIFMVTTIIPLILRTQVSLEGTINFILKYWAVFGLYILVRNTVTDNKKIKIIITTLIISSIIPIIFGYDKLLGLNVFQPFFNFINAVKIDDIRMISTFGYANTFAAYLGLTTSLAISEFLNVDKKKIKILYAIYIVIASITIMLTQSKFVLALLAFIILIFIAKGIKDKKINKKWIIIGISGIVLFFIYFFIAIQIEKPLKIMQEEKTCVIRGIESNTSYTFELDIDAKTDKTYDVFEINIVEVTKYFSEKIIGRTSFSNFNGIETIKVKTNDEIDHIEIRIKNQLNQDLTINGLTINGSKYILEYKIIPDQIVRIFTTFNFKNSSVWQRTDYWTDAIKIIKDRWLIGSGGNTWRTLYGQFQDYLYYAKEAHCYILEVWMSFGIVGLMSYIFIIAITLQNGLEILEKKKQETKIYRNLLAIFVGIIIIIVHSLMDFDMSYLIIEMLIYMFIAIINKDEQELKINTNIAEIIIISIFVVISIGNVLGLTASLMQDETGKITSKIAPWISSYQYKKIAYVVNNEIEDDNLIEYIKQYIKNEPYTNQNAMYKVMSDEIIKETKIEDINYLINTWKNIKKERKYEIEPIQERAEIMLEFAKNLLEKAEETSSEELKNKSKEVLEIIKEEYEDNRSAILDYRRNREAEAITKFKETYYTNVYNEAIKILEK